MKKKIKINFSKFYDGFDKKENFFFRQLNRKYEVEIADNPEVLFVSVFEGEVLRGAAKKVFFTGENIRPDLETCDWAFGFDYEDAVPSPRYMRLPLTVFEGDIKPLLEPRSENPKNKSRFCNFIYFHQVEFRELFFKRLSEYKQIDAPSRSMNNQKPIPRSISDSVVQALPLLAEKFSVSTRESRYNENWQSSKLPYLSKYKFTIAFENSSYPGYFTEKIVHPMMVGSIPIYWGNPEIKRDFNTKAFLNYHDFENEQSFIDRIIEVDQSDALYRAMLSEPWFVDGQKPDWANEERVLQRLIEIVES
jgi:hypothetical protein